MRVCAKVRRIPSGAFVTKGVPLCPCYAQASRKLGFPILYGDGSRPAVLQSASISSPKAVMVMYTGKQRILEAVQRIRLAFPAVPIYARAQDPVHLIDLKKAGATDAILENAETSIQLGSKLLKGLGIMSDDVAFLGQLVRDSMEFQAQESLNRTNGRDVMKPMQVRVADLIPSRSTRSSTSVKEERQMGHIEDQAEKLHILADEKYEPSAIQIETDQTQPEHSAEKSEDVEAEKAFYTVSWKQKMVSRMKTRKIR